MEELVIRAVVFDMDGLILNSEDVFDLAGDELLRRREREMTDSIRNEMIGRRPHEAFANLKRLTGMTEPVEELMLETKGLFQQYAETHLAVMPGFHDLLELVCQLNLQRAVATSSPREYMETLLSRFDLLHHFAHTLTAEDVQHGKPNPEIYATAAERLGIAPREMLVLEDSEAGTRAAAAAGAYIVAVPNRHTARQDFSAARRIASGLNDPILSQLLQQSGCP